MTIPNLTNPTKVEAKNAKQAVTTTATAIVSNSSSSNLSYRIISLYVANVDGTNAADITVGVDDGSSTRYICSAVAVPAKSTLSVITREDALYLMEGDSLKLTASADNDLEAIVSYEEIS